jgi:Transglycosylase SLT domain
MVTFPTFAVPNLGPPTADYASMIANIGKSFEDSYARSRERTLADQFAEATKAYAQQQQQTAPGSVPQPNAAAPGAPGYNPAGKQPSFVQLQGGMPSADIQGLINTTAATHRLDPAFLTRLVQVESRGDPNAYNSGSKASGLGQFIPGTWKQYGGGASPFDPGANLDATARLTKDNADFLRNGLGREPTPGELYLAHQQGKQGALNLLLNPDAPATSVTKRGNILANLPAGQRSNIDGLTAGQFASIWTGRFADLGQRAAAAASSGPPPGSSAAAPAGAVPAGAAPAASGAIPPAGAPDAFAIDNARQILANRRSTPPMVENAQAVLARVGVDPAATGAIPPGAATAPTAVPPQNGPNPIALPGGPASMVGASPPGAMVLPQVAGGPAVPPAAAPGGPAPTTPLPSVAAAPTGAPGGPAPASAPPAQRPAASPPPAASPAPSQPLPLPPTAPFNIPPALLAAMARNPATAAQAAAIIGQRATMENKPQVQEVGGVLYQYAPGRGWVPVAGQQKPEVKEAGGVLYERQPDSTWKPVTSGQSYSIIGPNDKDRRRAANIPDNDTRPYQIGPNGKSEPMVIDPTTFDREQKLRGDFDGQQQNKEFYTVRDQFQRMQTAFADPSGTGDLTTVFTLMKILDPGSTVREGEQASAQNVGGLAQKWLGLYNSLIDGTGTLTPAVREQIYAQARRMVAAQGTSYNNRVEQQHKLARQYSLTPDNVAQKYEVPDLKAPVPSGQPLKNQGGAAAPAAAPAPVNPVTGRPAAAPTTTPGAPGVPGANQDNPMPMPSPAAGDGLPGGTYFRTPDGKIWQSDGSGRR